MIRALSQIGEYSIVQSEGGELEELIDKIKQDNVLFLDFEQQGNEVIYQGTHIETFGEEMNIKILYKKGSARGGNVTPNQIIDMNDPEKSLRNFILPLGKLEGEVFQNISKQLKEKELFQRILLDIKTTLLPKSKYVLSLCINGKKNGEFEEIVQLLQTNSLGKYRFRSSFPKEDQYAVAQDKLCYVCNKRRKEVYGFVNTYNFYTLDKVGFMTSGFKRREAWKNYPVCPSCALKLDKGKRVVEEQLRDFFAGITYFVIPKFLYDLSLEENNKVYRRILKGLQESTSITLEETAVKGIMKKEETLLYRMADLENNLTVTLMFYNANNNEFKILNTIEDIFPSRLRTLFEIKRELEEDTRLIAFQPIVRNEGKKNEYVIEFNFTFASIKDYFEDDIDAYLNTIQAIFMGNKIDKKMLMTRIIEVVRKTYREGRDSERVTLQSFFLLNYLEKLGVLQQNHKGEVKAMPQITEKNKIYLEFLQKHETILDTDIKRGIFLEGLMVQKLMNIQYRELKSTPFYERLNGLKLSERLVKRILTEAEAKLIEYGKKNKVPYGQVIKELVAQYLLKANFKTLSNEEMSYYFVLGMNMSNQFKQVEEEKEGGNTDEQSDK